MSGSLRFVYCVHKASMCFFQTAVPLTHSHRATLQSTTTITQSQGLTNICELYPYFPNNTYTHTHTHTLGRNPGRMISPTLRPLPKQNTTLTGNRLSCAPAGFEPALPADERPQSHALDRAATGMILVTTRCFLEFT